MLENSFFPDEIQNKAADFVENPSVFLRGLPSGGKTTAALFRLQKILEATSSGVSDSVLVLIPQRSLAQPYHHFLQNQTAVAVDRVSIQTMSSLVRRMIDLFWPLIGSLELFAHPFEKPHFLTLETSQYYMAQIVNPMLDQGKFNTISLPLYRLCSQLIDNLNKSALICFPISEIGSRLAAAWTGDATRQNIYADVQEAVSSFRSLCYEKNLLDYSLQVEIFTRHLWKNQSFQKYLQNQYQHLIYDNCEEDPPYVHDCLLDWLPGFQSSLLVFDENAGYRSFLGADPNSALRLSSKSQTQLVTSNNYVSSQELRQLSACISKLQDCTPTPDLLESTLVFNKERIRFFPDLLEKLSDTIEELVMSKGVLPSDIAILSPFISDSLLFSLQNDLAQRGIKLSAQKPSMPLAQNATIKTLITLAKLAYPAWKIDTDYHLVASSLNHAISELDLIRAHLILGEIKPDSLGLVALPQAAESDGRIAESLLARYHKLKEFLDNIDQDEPLDNFLSRLFGEVLSQPGFNFLNNVQAGTSTAMLMESYRKFVQGLQRDNHSGQSHLGQAFVSSLELGLIPALYLSDWEKQPTDAILLAPVTSFLMRNEPVSYQFWLNIGSKGWYERLEQPLTHPIVLSRNWQAGKQWNSDEELAYNNSNLGKIIQGSLARCRQKVYLFYSDYNEAGDEERGQLLTLLQNLLRKSRQVWHD